MEISNLEMSKISDALVEKFGFDISHLGRAVEKFKLNENKEIASFQKMMAMQKQNEEKKAF